VASRFVKQGIWPFNPSGEDVAEAAHAKAQRDMLYMALASLGAGAGFRGLQGMHNLIKRTGGDDEDEKKKDKVTAYAPRPVETTIPVAKFGSDEAPASHIKQALFGVGDYIANLFSGKHATKPSDIPYYWVGMPTLGVGGLYGGYKGVDYLLDRQRREEQEEELESAREEFRRALQSRARAPKTASDAETDLGFQLDRLYDHIEKHAAFREKQAVMGQMAGAYSLYAVLSSLLTGVWMHEMTKKRGRRALLEHAQKKRLRQQFSVRPPEILAVPHEVGSAKKKKEKKDTPQLSDVPEPVEA
jgi:hypothetical protein